MGLDTFMLVRKFRSAEVRYIYVSQEVSLCGARYFLP